METSRVHRATIRSRGGVPTLHVDDVPHPAVGYLTFHPEARGRFRDFARAGIRLFAFNATSDFHSYGTARPVAVRPGVFDYRALDRRVGRILGDVPDALLIARVYIGSPPWWDATHPRELMRFEDGSCSREFRSGTLKRTVPSFSSRKWRVFASDALARLVRHVARSPYGGRVLGFHLMGGETEEWFYHGTYEGYLSDYSEVHHRAFRRWSRARASGGGLLRRLFNARVGQGTPVPEPHRRLAGGGVLLDPVSERDVAEYVLFRSREVVETIGEFADIVKASSGGRFLCGAFYGYVLELASHPLGLHHSGHLSFEKLLECPSIDFLSSPTSYLNRSVGSGYSAFMTMTDSAKLHGKLWFNENDCRTHLTPPAYGCGRTTTPEETTAVMRREFAHSMARGGGLWWFDMRGGWYRDADNMAEVARLTRLSAELVDTDRRSVAEVAVLVAGESLRYFRIGSPLVRFLLGVQIQELGRAGASFDCFHVRDLPSLRPYRFYLVLSPLALDTAERDALRKATRRPGTTTLWVYAPGIVRSGSWNEAGVSDLTGIPVRRLDSEIPAVVEVLPGSHPLVEGLSSRVVYGVPDPVRPLLGATGEAECVGRLRDDAEAVGLAVRSHGEWTSIFSSAPCLPASLLRSLIGNSGVHLFLDGDDVVYANRSMLAIHTRQAGVRRVRLPAAAAAVTDLVTGATVARHTRDIALELPAAHTALLRIDPSRAGDSV
jgi:hypothetical protein